MIKAYYKPCTKITVAACFLIMFIRLLVSCQVQHAQFSSKLPESRVNPEMRDLPVHFKYVGSIHDLSFIYQFSAAYLCPRTEAHEEE